MKVHILDDWFDTLSGLPCFARLAGHDVTVWTDHVEDVEELARRLADAEAMVLFRERTKVTRAPSSRNAPGSIGSTRCPPRRSSRRTAMPVAVFSVPSTAPQKPVSAHSTTMPTSAGTSRGAGAARRRGALSTSRPYRSVPIGTACQMRVPGAGGVTP